MKVQSDVNIFPLKDEEFEKVESLYLKAFLREDEGRLFQRLKSKDSYVKELSLVAVLGKEIVGHILFTPVIIMDGENTKYPSLSLTAIAVMPEFQNKGIGRRLVEEGKKTASDLGYKTAVVLGESGFFSRLGFVPAIDYDIRAPFDVPEDSLLVSELVEGGFGAVAGIILYPEEFYN